MSIFNRGNIIKDNKVSALTPEQQEKLKAYRKMGEEMSLDTGPDFDEAEVHEIMNNHRESLGLPRASKIVVFDSAEAAILDDPNRNTANAMYGQQSASWLMFYQFWRMEIGVPGLDSIAPLIELAKRVNWVWASEDTNVVSRRPEHVHTILKPDNTGEKVRVLHNFNGKALEFRDGTGVYVCNGTTISSELGQKLIDTPVEDIDVREILNIRNTEERTELFKKVGSSKSLLDVLEHKVLDRDTLKQGGSYTLYKLDMGNDTFRYYLEGECPSNSEPFFECIPPVDTVRQALSWRNTGISTNDFVEPEVLT